MIENSPATEFKQAISEVVVARNTTDIVVSGHLLEAVVKVDENRYLFFTTDDVIYEEFLTVTLISINDGVLESLQSGNGYSPGFLKSSVQAMKAHIFTLLVVQSAR